MFQSKIVVITGASTGIGAGTAIKFAQEGASGILLHGRNATALQEVKRLCDQAGRGKVKAHICIGDITQEEVRQKIIDETIKEFGQLDILFHNAGIIGQTLASNVPMDLYDQIFDVNLRSVIALNNLAVPHLIKSRGNIITNSSVLGSIASWPMNTVYCLTKAALEHFTRILAVELGPKGVRVNCIKPGLIEGTDVFNRLGMFQSESHRKEVYQEITKIYPLGGRAGTVDEVADLVLFLASDKASFITGACIPIDGGHTKVASGIA